MSVDFPFMFTTSTDKLGGHIDTQQLAHLSLGPNDTVEKKAWMDKTVMHDWINIILEP